MTGPAFLAAYLGAAAVAFAIAFYLRGQVIGPYKRALRTAFPGLSPEAQAYVLGGLPRVLELALFDLHEVNRIAVDANGKISASGAGTGLRSPVAEEIAAVVAKEPKTFVELMRGSLPSVDEIRIRLDEERLLPPASELRRARRRSMAPFWVLLAVGIARLAMGAVRGRPIGFLFMLLLATAATLIVLSAYTFTGRDAVDTRPPEADLAGTRAAILYGGLSLVAAGALSAFASDLQKGYPRTPPSGSGCDASSCSGCGSSCGSSCGGGGGCGGCGGGGD